MSWFSEQMAKRYGGMAEFYEFFTRGIEKYGVRDVRAELATPLRGRILEIGCGTGLNFKHYHQDVKVTAIEPLKEFREFAGKRAAEMPAGIEVVEGDAEHLDFADNFFDAALATLVFCSIPRPKQALAELRRVVKKGGPVHFYEHVRHTRPLPGLLQDIANPFWAWAMDGCNLNRDTVRLIEEAGFKVAKVEVFDIDVPGMMPVFPARKIWTTA